MKGHYIEQLMHK